MTDTSGQIGTWIGRTAIERSILTGVEIGRSVIDVIIRKATADERPDGARVVVVVRLEHLGGGADHADGALDARGVVAALDLEVAVAVPVRAPRVLDEPVRRLGVVVLHAPAGEHHLVVAQGIVAGATLMRRLVGGEVGWAAALVVDGVGVGGVGEECVK